MQHAKHLCPLAELGKGIWHFRRKLTFAWCSAYVIPTSPSSCLNPLLLKCRSWPLQQHISETTSFQKLLPLAASAAICQNFCICFQIIQYFVCLKHNTWMVLPSQPTSIGQGHLRGGLSGIQVGSGWLFMEQLLPSTCKAGQSKSRNFFPKCLCNI